MSARIIWSCEYDGCTATTETTAEIKGGGIGDEIDAVWVPEPFRWVGGFEGHDDWTLCPEHYDRVMAKFNAENPGTVWIA